MDNSDEQFMQDLNLAWLEKKWAKFSGSNIISLLAGVDDPNLLNADKTEIVINAIKQLPADAFSKTNGKPLVKPLNALIASFDVTGAELNYAYKKSKPSEGLITYAEKVAVQLMTKFTPDPELTKPWIIRGRELEVPAIEKLSNILDMDFENIGHDQQFILHPDYDDYGSTPDALYKQGGITKMTLEGKCPNSETHLKYRKIKDAKTMKEIESRYYWQVQSQMDCNETDKALFFSFDDRFLDESKHLHYCYIERNDNDIDKIHERLNLARQWRDEFLSLNE